MTTFSCTYKITYYTINLKMIDALTLRLLSSNTGNTFNFTEMSKNIILIFRISNGIHQNEYKHAYGPVVLEIACGIFV